MRLVHYWAPLFGEPAGVSAAIADWSAHQATAGHEVVLLGDGDPASSGQAYPDQVDVRGIPHRGRGRMSRVPVGLAGTLRGTDLLVLHEGYTAHQYAAATAARRAHIPYVVVPHGVYHRAWRSMLRFEHPRRILERQFLRHAAAVHLFFESERAEIRAVCPGARTLVVPTGVELPERTWTGGAELLWIGRYSVEHKGLDLLLQAMAAIPGDVRPKLLMRGYDYNGGKTRLVQLRAQLGLAGHVEVGPPVDAAEKDQLLRSCAGWVQPSRWESHSIALLEALGRGVPALISDRMPISSELRRADAARVTGLDVATLAAALREFGGPLDGALGDRGRAYARDHFAWPAVMARHDVEYGRLAVGSGSGARSC